MFRTFLLIFLLCGLTVFSVLTEDRTSAETSECQPLRMCRFPETPPPCETIPCAPSVQPPECEMPACSAVLHPWVHRRCVPSWQKQMTEPVMRSPEVFPQRGTDSMLCRWCSLRMSCGQCVDSTQTEHRYRRVSVCKSRSL